MCCVDARVWRKERTACIASTPMHTHTCEKGGDRSTLPTLPTDAHTCDDFTCATSCGLGAPITSKIKVSWCTKFLPGKRGLRPRSSAKMQPTDLVGVWMEEGCVSMEEGVCVK